MLLSNVNNYSGWKDIIWNKFCNLELEIEKEHFTGTIQQKIQGSDQFLSVRSKKQLVTRTNGNVRTDPSDTVLLLLQKSGRGVVSQGGKQAYLDIGDFALCDTSSPYQLNFDHDFEQIILKLSRSSLLNYLPELPDATAHCLSHRCAAANVVTGFIQQLDLNANNLTEFELGNFTTSLEHMLATAIRLSVNGFNDRSKKRLSEVKALILREIRDPSMNLEQLFFQSGIGMRTVQRMFQSEGETLTNWVNKQRFSGAAQDLRSVLESRRSITDIAFSWGFKDVSHFSRGFKSVYKMSPRQWRSIS
ncbi:helix-turn-helix domain-containing protein [Klebsiella michiganensis]|uniref:helix-turn-helix domain-containing protein n=1 Tax=Klebsiella TaxID=570 RepID=UPI000DE72E4F|nr:MULTISPECIES: helix-turn-helix domain-containing protein [Klebsiella]MEB6370941.1 helix-turn-helix domain-containing protein [Klebsiella michiganensis]UXO79603.1 helix-turn-helix domain-containing protein [Klebsiella michiganensis]SSG25523.1 transcriptional activator feaR [Klebsiella pneumoniae]HBZ7326258.1 helix-turn-helix domain-containing protein [Klebsiella pneumoniae]HBZ7351963.1 helix-turn-helix domain-containing protein [Klebsiella pneumoniae]